MLLERTTLIAGALCVVVACAAEEPSEEFQAELRKIEHELDEPCDLPPDPANVPECAFCTRQAYADYRSYYCSHKCGLGLQLPPVDYYECRKQKQKYELARSTCKFVAQEEPSSYACCSGFDVSTIPSIATSLVKGIGSLVGKALAKGAGQAGNFTHCPRGSVLCRDTSTNPSCPSVTEWCVPAQGDCVYEDPDMPFLCGRTTDQYGTCNDSNPCPPGFVKMLRRPTGVPLGTGLTWLCVPAPNSHKCDPFVTPPTCPAPDGTCGPCSDRNCPRTMRWDKAQHRCIGCPAGMAIAVDNTTGATSCVVQAQCASGVMPIDVTPERPECPLSCEAPLSCTWGTVSLTSEPAFICPYCNLGSF